MKEVLKNNKQIIIIGIAMLALLIVGISFAYLVTTIRGEKEYIVRAGSLALRLEEANELTLEVPIPIEDEKGLALEGFNFSLINEGKSHLGYTIYLDDIPLEEGEERMADTAIRYSLTKGTSVGNATNLENTGTNPNRIIDTGNIAGSQTIDYTLKIWLDYDATVEEASGKVFKAKLRVVTSEATGVNAPELDNNMIAVSYDGSNWIKTSSTNANKEWYDYDNQKWANAVTLDHTKVLDLSGNGNTAEINGSQYLDGKAVIKGQNDEFINCGFENYDFQNGITYIVRAKITYLNADSSSDIIGNWQSAGGGMGYNYPNKKLFFNLYINNAYYSANYNIEDSAILNKYNVYIGTYDGKKIKTYLNGKEAGETTIEGNIKASTIPIAIGANLDLNTDGGFKLTDTSNLEISDALIFDRAISSDEAKKYSENIDNIENKNNLLAWYNFDDEIADETKIDMDAISTMLVWIPRYSYTIGSVDGTNYYGKQGEFLETTPSKELPGEIDIKFVSKNVKDRGSAKYKVSDDTSEISGWYTPDAFTFGDEELGGIWVGKFETSSSNPSATNGGGNTTSLDPMIKPNVTSWRYINLSNAFNVTLRMNDTGNRYGLTSNVDTHIIKNSEWAAVAYLSQSKYGKLGNTNYTGANKEIYQNKSDQNITGCSYGAPSNENTDYGCQYTYDIDIKGTGASTTGNIYGIYDMNGGSYDAVMGNYNNVVGSSGFSSMPDAKYYDKYTSDDVSTACSGSICLSHGLSETSGWYNDSNTLTSEQYPWMIRSGRYSASGIFFYYGSSGLGGPTVNVTYRIAISKVQ